MNTTWIILILAIVLFIVLFIIIIGGKTPIKRPPIVAGTSITSLNIDTLKPLMQQTLDYIKNNSKSYNPYNKDIFNYIENNIMNTTTPQQFVLQSLLLPNMNMGNIPIEPLGNNPLQTTLFQYNQGNNGWYFLFGVFKNIPIPTSYFFYICRVDTIPANILLKNNLPLGSSAYYNIAGGIGQNYKWNYSPFVIFPGTLNILTESTFNFNGFDMPTGMSCNFSSPNIGSFDLDFQWLDPITNNPYGINANINSLRQSYYNGDNGCAPCVGGAGTLYWSYPNLTTNATLNFNNVNQTFNDGTGWVDRQWVNTNISSNFVSILDNISNTFKYTPKGLNKYLWFTMNVSADLQYLLYTFPTDSININNVYDVFMNKYDMDGIDTSSPKGKCKILSVVTIDNIVFPSSVEITIKNIVYVLDSQVFGNPVVYDVSGNFHWVGTSLLTQNGVNIGMGFIEANHLQTSQQYNSTFLAAAGLDPNNFSIIDGKKFTFGQTWWSFFVIILIIISIILIIIYSVKLSLNK